MSRSAVVRWLMAHEPTLAMLEHRVAVAVQSNGHAVELVDQPAVAETVVVQALIKLARAATALYETVRYAKTLVRIPDKETERHFAAALARWEDASESLASAVDSRNVPEIRRCGRALAAGSDEFRRMAAALRRATGVPPDLDDRLNQPDEA